MNEIRLFPLYCPHCGRLTLRHPQGLLDLKHDRLAEHPCKLHQKKPIQESLPPFVENEGPIFFQTRTLPGQRKLRDPQWGLILEQENSDEWRVLALENQIIGLKTLFQATELRPGDLVSLKKAQRIGQQRYRLETKELLFPPSDLLDLALGPIEFYRLNLSSRDQNHLENITGRFLDLSLQEGIHPFALTLGAIETKEGERVFHRALDLDPSAKLLQTFEGLPLPPSVQLSIQQLSF